jgi:hypothetical protein
MFSAAVEAACAARPGLSQAEGEAIVAAVIERIREPEPGMIEHTFVRKPIAWGQIGPMVWRTMLDAIHPPRGM